MGDYTRLKLSLPLKSSTPLEVVAILDYLTLRPRIDEPKLLDDPFFKIDRWDSMLKSTSGAGYFPQADGIGALDRLPDGGYTLSSHSSFKDYDGLMSAFFSWIAPHIDAAPGTEVGESEFDGFFGKVISKLTAQPCRIVSTKVTSGAESDGFF